MTITYDPESKRATHLESGMSVQYLRRGAVFQDMSVYFGVTYNAKTIVFESTVSHGHEEIMAKFPELDAMTVGMIVKNMNKTTYSASGIKFNIENDAITANDICDLLVQLWWTVVHEMRDRQSNVTVTISATVNEKPVHWIHSG